MRQLESLPRSGARIQLHHAAAFADVLEVAVPGAQLRVANAHPERARSAQSAVRRSRSPPLSVMSRYTAFCLDRISRLGIGEA
jgi:hypothetical protein